jgi:hypothetical protein
LCLELYLSIYFLCLELNLSIFFPAWNSSPNLAQARPDEQHKSAHPDGKGAVPLGIVRQPAIGSQPLQRSLLLAQRQPPLCLRLCRLARAGGACEAKGP